MSSVVKWIKIVTDIFDDEKVLLIESLPEADAIIVVWIKLLCFAGKQNNHGIFVMNNKVPYTEKMLSIIFRRKEAIVHLALKTFVDFGMVEIVDGVITIPNWEKYQSLDVLEQAREKTRQRVDKYRKKQRLLAMNNDCNVTRNVTCNTMKRSVTPTDKDIDKDKYISSVEDTYCPVAPDAPSPKPKKNTNFTSQAKTIIEYFNTKANTSYKASNRKTLALIKARMSEGFTVDDFKTVIDKKTLEWGQEPNMCQYLRPLTLFSNKFESYLNQPSQAKNTANKFANFEQRDWDWDKINEILDNG